MKITKKLAAKLHEGKKVEVKVENFLPKASICPKGNYPFPQYPTPPSPNLPICVICVICGFLFSGAAGRDARHDGIS